MWEHLRVSQLMADILSRGAASLAGLFLLGATTLSLMRTVVIPRALRSIISDAVAKVVVGVATGISRLRRSYPKRDGTLAWTGPTIIIAQLVTWLLMYLLAYGLLIYGASGSDFGESLRQAGSSLFTLGFASVNTEDQTIIDFMAAATGPIVIALLIGFLPTIYSTYLEREVDITMLSATGGEPAWGPELLSRMAMGGTITELPQMFMEWAKWATRLRLTHVTYPVLVYVRSARAMRHYVVALLAVMDAAALKLALTTKLPRKEAFTLLLEGGQTFEVLYVFLFMKRTWATRMPFSGQFTGQSSRARLVTKQLPGWNDRMIAVHVASDMDAVQSLDGDAVRALQRGEQQPLTITRADFDHAVDVMVRSGFPIDRDLDEAWDLFRAARGRYEFAALEICRRLDATPAPWSGTRSIPTPTVWPTLACEVLPRLEENDDQPPAPESAGSPS
jgi:hypothetical protein